ncbi:kinase-like protein [Clavulina sp. PMI_390]|nr:kinase-like protein [Clavulina sp. PMI_390]
MDDLFPLLPAPRDRPPTIADRRKKYSSYAAIESVNPGRLVSIAPPSIATLPNKGSHTTWASIPAGPHESPSRDSPTLLRALEASDFANISLQSFHITAAITYVKHIKATVENWPTALSRFRDIVKDLKSELIHPSEAVANIANLFFPHPGLIQAFNVFLPAGYLIKCAQGEDGGLEIILTYPSGSTTTHTISNSREDPINERKGAFQADEASLEQLENQFTVGQLLELLGNFQKEQGLPPEVIRQLLAMLSVLPSPNNINAGISPKGPTSDKASANERAGTRKSTKPPTPPNGPNSKKRRISPEKLATNVAVRQSPAGQSEEAQKPKLSKRPMRNVKITSAAPPRRKLKSSQPPPTNHTEPADSDSSEYSDAGSGVESKLFISPSMAKRFSIDSQILNISHGQALDLLDLINSDIRKQPSDSHIYTETLRLLQDLCYYFCAIPRSFILENVLFSRTLESIVGRGGEATLYRGQVADGNYVRPVVVREVSMAPWEWELPVGRKVTQLIHREAITHSLLTHPNILPFVGIYHEKPESPPITVLPLIERGSLQKILVGTLVESNTLQQILLGVANGVVYLHSLHPPIVHGDLHPGNILVDSSNNPYLCDFGLSRIRHEVTRTRTLLREGGMRRFMAPELSAGFMERFRTNISTDVFSLSMTFLNIWSGHPPFSEVRQDAKVVANFRNGLRPEEPSISVALSRRPRRQLWKLLNKMWAQIPANRPSSADVLDCLIRIFPDKGLPKSSSSS